MTHATFHNLMPHAIRKCLKNTTLQSCILTVQLVERLGYMLCTPTILIWRQCLAAFSSIAFKALRRTSASHRGRRTEMSSSCTVVHKEFDYKLMHSLLGDPEETNINLSHIHNEGDRLISPNLTTATEPAPSFSVVKHHRSA